MLKNNSVVPQARAALDQFKWELGFTVNSSDVKAKKIKNHFIVLYA